MGQKIALPSYLLIKLIRIKACLAMRLEFFSSTLGVKQVLLYYTT